MQQTLWFGLWEFFVLFSYFCKSLTSVSSLTIPWVGLEKTTYNQELGAAEGLQSRVIVTEL